MSTGPSDLQEWLDDANRPQPPKRREPLYPDRCLNCGRRTEAGPCPLCGVVVCQLCAEREGSFCCDGGES